jgi:hypothetical protein
MSIGRQNRSDEASLTSGASPTSGSVCHCVPSMVLFDVMCAYAALAVNDSSACVGMRVKLSALVVSSFLSL